MMWAHERENRRLAMERSSGCLGRRRHDTTRHDIAHGVRNHLVYPLCFRFATGLRCGRCMSSCTGLQCLAKPLLSQQTDCFDFHISAFFFFFFFFIIIIVHQGNCPTSHSTTHIYLSLVSARIIHHAYFY